MITPVSDTGSNSEKNIARAVRALGRSKPRVAVFEAIYFHKGPVKTVDEIAQRTGLTRKAVLTHGKHLVGSEMAIQLKIKGDTAYRTIPFYQHHKQKILRFVADPSRMDKLVNDGSITISIASRPSAVPKRELRKHKTLTVLYMFANPDPDPDSSKYI